MIVKQNIKCLLVLLAALFFSIQLNAVVRLPRLIANGMILQRNIPLKIWGWADKGEKVTVEFMGETFQTKADKSCKWSVVLPPMKACGPSTMKINEIELLDVLIGDVWLCSGQSNMELPIRRVMDLYQNEITQINNNEIRQFRCSSRNDFDAPQNDYKDGAWLAATPANIMDFSAVAYFFANELYQKNHVPIGLINTAIGGSPAESWISEIPAKSFRDEWLKAQAKVDSIRTIKKLEGKILKPSNWIDEVNKKDEGVGRWSKANVDVSDWQKTSLPGYWTDKGIVQKHGSLWFYKEFELADSLVGKEAVLRMGRIIDSDSTFVNGVFVGTTSYQYPPRIYNIPPGVLKKGRNSVMVRVICQSGKGGFVEEKPYSVRVASQVIDLTGEWRYKSGAEMQPPTGLGNLQFMPGGLYNGLIAPSINFEIKGVIWYQGESNTGRSKEYEKLMSVLINDWRTQYGNPKLPFLYVQLANLGRPNMQPVESGWAELRDAQRRGLQLPNTGMAVACDIGEWNDIHPLNKKEVGRRLSLEAMRVADNDSLLVSSGPLYTSMTLDGNSAILTFSSVGSGLYANSFLEGFQVAGPDGRFVWANAVVMSKNTVRVWHNNIPKPTIVRYAWEDNPERANLKNKEGLPASPFSTKQ